MDDPKVILSLLGISWEMISNYEITTDNENTFINLELKDLRPRCKFCGSDDVQIKDYYSRHINDSIIKHKKCIIEVRQRRYYCPRCKKTFKQNVPFIETKASISNAVKQSIIDDLKESRTMLSIAREHHVSPTTVMNIFDKIIFNEMAVHLPAALCIDEFHFINRKSLGKFPAMISDYFTGNPIDIIKSRKKEYLFEYFNKVKLSERLNVKYFISDMNESYRTLKKAFFKDAVHIIDMFHIAKLFTNSIQKVRTRIMKKEEYESKEYRYLKRNWKLFLMHQDKLKLKKKVNKSTGEVTDLAIEVNYVLRHYPELNKCYQLFEDFHHKTKYPMMWNDADKFVNFVINNAKNSQIPELEELGRSFTNWKYEITNTFAKTAIGIKLSNAVAEANNNNVQTLIDASYGLMNFERMRKRFLYIISNKKTRER